MGYGKSVQDELREPSRELRKAIPSVYQGFAQLHEASPSAEVRPWKRGPRRSGWRS